MGSLAPWPSLPWPMEAAELLERGFSLAVLQVSFSARFGNLREESVKYLILLIMLLRTRWNSATEFRCKEVLNNTVMPRGLFGSWCIKVNTGTEGHLGYKEHGELWYTGMLQSGMQACVQVGAGSPACEKRLFAKQLLARCPLPPHPHPLPLQATEISSVSYPGHQPWPGIWVYLDFILFSFTFFVCCCWCWW